MRKSKLVVKTTAIALALTTMFSSMSIAYAEDSTVTDKPLIDMVFENKVGTKKMSEEDGKIFAEAMGYDSFEGEVDICSEDTSADIDWENSLIPMEEVYATQIIVPVLSRDGDGNLVVTVEDTWEYRVNESWKEEDVLEPYGAGHGSYFDKTGNRVANVNGNNSMCINDGMGITSIKTNSIQYPNKDIADIYIIRFRYTTDGLGNIYGEGSDVEDRAYGYSDFCILSEGIETVLNLEDIEEDTPADDETVDNYVADLTTGNTVVSATDFATILTENETKDVVINTNNDVTFTFAKGTMKAVEGLESYDFTTTVSTTYKSDLPSYVTKDNFVSLIDYNYSGKLPAEASIKIPVSTEYAGKTLYYSLMNEDNTYAEVQTVVVDAEGYMTVKQDHCSTYVLTSTEPKLEDSTDSTEPTTDNTTEPTTDSKEEPTATEETTTGKTEQTTPDTGDNSAMFVYFLLAVSAIGAVFVSRKYKNA